MKNHLLRNIAIGIFLLMTFFRVHGQITVSGTNSATNINSSTATAVAPDLTITAGAAITDFTVSIIDSYSLSDVLSFPVGTLPSGVTALPWSSTTRSIVFRGTKTAAEWQAFLRTVNITSGTVCSPETRKVSFAAGETYYNPINGHFYRLTNTQSSWTATQTTASSTSYYGREGYLVTLTSAAENTFVSRLVGQNSWMGASDDYTQINDALGYTAYANQSAAEGKFYWVTGPEKGTQLTTNNGNGNTVSGVYQNWRSGEPNNAGTEHYGHVYAASEDWNDFPNSVNIFGILEFGGMPNDMVASAPQFTKEIFIQGSSSGSISGGNTTVCSGANATTLTLNGLAGTVVRWESSTNNFITTGTAIANTTTTLTVSNISETTYYRAVVNSSTPSACNGLVTSSTPIFVSEPNAGNVFAVNTTVCAGSDVELYISGQDGTVEKWQRSPNNSTWTDIASTNPTLTETVPSTGTFYYRVFVEISGCGAPVTSPSKQITVVNGTAPIGGQVSSAAHGSTTNSGTLTLTGQTGTISKWQRSTDNGIIWTDIANTTTTQTYTNIATKTLFRAQLVNGNCGSTYSEEGSVAILSPPSITNFTPKLAGNGETVTLTGTGFTGTTSVAFGASNALSFTVVSDTELTAVVGTGSSGAITVINPVGNDAEAGFIYKVANYDFENNVLDGTNNNYDGTVINTVSYETGAEGQAVCFDNGPGYVELPNDLIRNLSEFTISLRFKTTESGSILGYQNSTAFGGVTNYIPIIMINSNGHLLGTLWTSASSPIQAISANPVNDGNWHQVDFTASTNTVSIYLDGNLEATTSGASVAHLDMSFNQLGLAYTSNYNLTSTTWEYFNGCLDNLLITDRALTALEIQDNTALPEPTIISFTPTAARENETVVITGTNFDGATQVSFGGTNAVSYTVDSSAQITAVLGTGASGAISVVTAGGTATASNFSYHIAAYTLSETALTISENAGTDSFTVVLGSQPTSNVVFDITSNDTAEATVSSAQLSFTPANWDTPQTITVTAVDDNDYGNDAAIISISVNGPGSDDAFDGLANQSVSITLTDEGDNLPVFTNPLGLQDFSNTTFIGSQYLTSSVGPRKLGLEFSNNGTKMYSIAFDNDLIVEYTLSTPYSVATATRTYELSVTANGQYPRGLAFSADGSKMFILSRGTKVIYAYNLTTPYDLSTAVLGTDTFDISTYTSLSVEGVDFNPEGTRMYLTNSRTNSCSIEQFDLGTPFEIATASYLGTKAISPRFNNSVYGITFGNGGKQMFIGNYSDGRVVEYRLSTPYDVSSATITANNGNVFSLSTPTDIVFSSTFDKVFILRYGQSSVYEYNIGNQSLEFQENSTAIVTDVDANNGDGGASDASITYSLVGGGDNDLFAIDSGTGELSFIDTPDFETPQDTDTNNVYEITVIATDINGNTQMDIEIEVTDIDEIDPTLVLTGDVTRSTDSDNCFYTVQGTELDPSTATDDSGSLTSLTYSLQKMTPNPNLVEENFNTGSWNATNFELGTNTGSVVNGAYKSDTSSRGTLRTVADFVPTLENPLYVSATLSFANFEGIAFIGTRSTGAQPSGQFNSEPQGLNLRIHNFNEGQTSTATGYDFQPRPGTSFYSNPVRFQLVDDGASMSVTMTNLVTDVSHTFSYNTNYSTGSNRIVFSGDNAVSWDDIEISIGAHEFVQEYKNGTTSLAGTTVEPGENTLLWTAEDAAGNAVSKSQIITVEDTIDPVVVTQNITITLDNNGLASITPSEIDDNSTDNCGIDSIVLDKEDFTAIDTGENTVTLTVTDINGNVNTATATVTVVNPDFDSDGVNNDIDNCPTTANADQLDTDNDGEGNICDDDDDNDGTLDTEDAFPLDPLEDTDTDNDGTGDNADTDDDNDGTLDTADAFPLDPTEDWDTDNDGTGDNADTDDDNDGTLDTSDAFPLDPTEDTDADNDGIGDNADTDDDNDGTLDTSDAFPLDPTEDTDSDNDGTGDNADTDDDNDGTMDTADAFPLDPTEDTDTDNDGIGDNADTDDDNDGTLDTADTFPLDPTEDTDSDNDGTGDNADTDDDNDGTLDTADAFPLDPTEDTDSDNDGTGDNADTDDDNDGTLDTADAFPLDPTEDTDSDNDGTGDNADTDDDNDGTLDTADAFPLDPTEDTDSDNDGTGDNADTDDDNDGTLDTADAFPLDPIEDTDTDNDGTGDNADNDDDNDGTLDTSDAFPLDPTEDTDSDNDGTGDNADTDDDNDGTLDTADAFPLDPTEDSDTDNDGIGDNEETDDDNDGTLDMADAFPLDPAEDTDTDNDGTGNNADLDDDGDGQTDDDETTCGSDPLDATSSAADADNDMIPDCLDNDTVIEEEEEVVEEEVVEEEEVEVEIVEKEKTIVCAEAITPNGDNINDTWYIQNIDNYPSALVTVFNRNGHEVFRTTNYNNDWDGRRRSNSEKLPPGSYYYVIDLNNGSAAVNGWLFINY